MRFLYFLFLLLNTLFAWSEGTSNKVSGKIRDMDSGQPVDSVTITVVFGVQPFSAITDANGEYTILTNVQYLDNDFQVKVSRTGYHELGGFIHVTKESVHNFAIKKIATKIKEDTLPKISMEGLATNNWVFLLDISASMNTADKLPLLQKGLKNIVELFRKDDQVAIVAFSGAAKEILPSTNGLNKDKIFQAIDEIQPGGKSAGAAAVEAAYQTAKKNYIPNGNNRIIIATDGLFTSGEKDLKAIKKIIEKNLEKNIHC
jgi:hypothetical protein